jgi:hypothetical protein
LATYKNKEEKLKNLAIGPTCTVYCTVSRLKFSSNSCGILIYSLQRRVIVIQQKVFDTEKYIVKRVSLLESQAVTGSS